MATCKVNGAPVKGGICAYIICSSAEARKKAGDPVVVRVASTPWKQCGSGK